MQCPVCAQEQVIVEHREVELDLCLAGCGIWFDRDELRQLFEVAGSGEALRDLERRIVELPGAEAGPRRRCPRCDAFMSHVRAPGPGGGVILDRCPHGHGLWFDPGELEAILSVEWDAGDAALARVQEFLGQFQATGEAAAPFRTKE